MSNRFDGQPVKNLSDGRRVYRSKIYPKIPFNDTDIYVATQRGDRLDYLAYQYYGDVNYWWIIAAANNLRKAPFSLEEGLILRIPRNYLQIVSSFNTD